MLMLEQSTPSTVVLHLSPALTKVGNCRATFMWPPPGELLQRTHQKLGRCKRRTSIAALDGSPSRCLSLSPSLSASASASPRHSPNSTRDPNPSQRPNKLSLARYLWQCSRCYCCCYCLPCCARFSSASSCRSALFMLMQSSSHSPCSPPHWQQYCIQVSVNWHR